MKKMNKKGFTLAELLIVLAIMAILIEIAIPVFSAQLEKARHSVDENSARSAKSLAEAHYMLEHVGGDYKASKIECTFSEDTNGNLEIMVCTPTFSGSVTNGCTYATAKAGAKAIVPQCTGNSCGSVSYNGKSLKVAVENGLVTGGWVD